MHAHAHNRRFDAQRKTARAQVIDYQRVLIGVRIIPIMLNGG
jgi:hypothetical protein